MSAYGRTIATIPSAGGSFQINSACFTGAEAYAVATAGTLGAVFVGAAAVGILGFLIALVTGPEPITKAAAFMLGAKIGAVTGFLFAAFNLAGGKCNCPGWLNYGFCVLIMCWVPASGAYPIPLFIMPSPSECGVLVPPGCP